MLGLIATGTVGGSAMTFHFRFGYALLSLLLFRLVWGVVGGHWSRFRSFLFGPAALLAYLRGQHPASHSVGHSPLGALSVWAMLVFLMLQVGTGLVSDDEIATMGPLSSWVSGAVVSWATSWHKGWDKLILIMLVTIHLLALAWYRWQKQTSLVPAMWHGNKVLPESTRASRDNLVSRALALLLLTLAALAVATLVSLGN